MKKRRQPNAAGFLQPVQTTVESTPEVEVAVAPTEPEVVVAEESKPAIPTAVEELKAETPVKAEPVKTEPVDDGDDDGPIAL